MMIAVGKCVGVITEPVLGQVPTQDAVEIRRELHKIKCERKHDWITVMYRVASDNWLIEWMCSEMIGQIWWCKNMWWEDLRQCGKVQEKITDTENDIFLTELSPKSNEPVRHKWFILASDMNSTHSIQPDLITLLYQSCVSYRSSCYCFTLTSKSYFAQWTLNSNYTWRNSWTCLYLLTVLQVQLNQFYGNGQTPHEAGYYYFIHICQEQRNLKGTLRIRRHNKLIEFKSSST